MRGMIDHVHQDQVGPLAQGDLHRALTVVGGDDRPFSGSTGQPTA